MRHRKKLFLAALVAGIAAFQACSKTETEAAPENNTASLLNLPAIPYNYNTAFPSYAAQALQATDNTPANNPITNDGATLGRVLFYDVGLSQNNTISCASCHKPTEAFGDNAVKSLGFKGGLTGRHSMRLLNVRFYGSGKMFWDERAATLEQQVLMPIQDTTEMGMTLPALVTRLSNNNIYPSLFQKAFGSTEVNSDRIARALSQFIRSLVTYNASTLR